MLLVKFEMSKSDLNECTQRSYLLISQLYIKY